MQNQQGIIPQIAQHFEQFKKIRHTIHQHPELAYQENKTSQLVASYLTQWGYKVLTGIGKTGLVASLTVGTSPKSIAIRADMDALPIKETTHLPYQSTREGIMHACGHDGHTTTLLATAQYLAQTKQFSGTVYLIFQPAEEGGAGAKAILDDGLLEKAPCDMIFSMHNYPSPDIKIGQMCINTGAIMASADSILVRLIGKGCHAASPHFGHDPIVASSFIIQALQTLVSRNTDPQEAVVLSVTSIHAGNSYNVIPNELELKMTLRTLSESQRTQAKQRITDIIQQQAHCFGLIAEIIYPDQGYPCLVNALQPTTLLQTIAQQKLGSDKVISNYPPIMASDDFAFMSQVVPSCYINVGNGDSAPLHNSAYDFNDYLILSMGSLWAHLVETYLTDNLLTNTLLSE